MSMDEEVIAALLPVCRREIKLSIVPPVRTIFGTAAKVDRIAEIPVIEYRTWDSRTTLLGKRAHDAAAASPRRRSRRPRHEPRAATREPRLFAQARASRNGKPLRMLEFRTMRGDAEERLAESATHAALDELAVKIVDDTRTTRVGRFRRRWSIDELPQLWNTSRRHEPHRAAARAARGRRALPGTRPPLSSASRCRRSCAATAHTDPTFRAGPHSCPACGRPLEPWREALLRCSGCGSAAAVAGVAASRDDYVQPQSRRLAAPLASALAFGTREQLRLLGRLPAGSRVLDLGAGDGRLAAALAHAGQRVTAVEPFREVVAARGVDGVEVVRSGVQEVELPEHAYDVVVLWHVLEHLADPGAALERVRGWLASQGCLLVGVPNLDSLQARLGRDRWFHLDRQRHLVHFTPPGLDLLLERSGFRPVERRHVLLDQAVPGMWMTLLNRLTLQQDALRAFVRREPVQGRDLAVTAVAAAPLLVFGTVLELAAAATGRGGALAVLAQPKR